MRFEDAKNPYAVPDPYRRMRAGIDSGTDECIPHEFHTSRGLALLLDAGSARDNEILSPYYADAIDAHKKLTKACPGITKRREVRIETADYIAHGVTLAELPERYQVLATKLHECRQWAIWGIDTNGELLLQWDGAAGLVKLCPDDAREEGQRVLEQYGDALLIENSERGQQLRACVFTTPNVPLGDLEAGMREIWKRFNDRILCYRKKNRPFKIKGALVTLEAPLSADGDWNIHLNAIVIFEGWPSYKALRNAWGYNVEIKRLGGRSGWRPADQSIRDAITELVKYPLKAVSEKAREKADGGWTLAPGLTQWPYAAFYEWYEAHHRHRRTRSSGCLYGIRRPEPRSREYTTWAGKLRFIDGQASPGMPILHRPAEPAVDLIQRNKFAENRGLATVDKSASGQRWGDDPDNYAGELN